MYLTYYFESIYGKLCCVLYKWMVKSKWLEFMQCINRGMRRLYQEGLPRVALLRKAGGRSGRGGIMFTGGVRAQRQMETVPGYLSVQSPLSLQSAVLEGQSRWYSFQLIIASHVSFPQNTEGRSHCVLHIPLAMADPRNWLSESCHLQSPLHLSQGYQVREKRKERKKKVFRYNLPCIFLPAPFTALLPSTIDLLLCVDLCGARNLCWFN